MVPKPSKDPGALPDPSPCHTVPATCRPQGTPGPEHRAETQDGTRGPCPIPGPQITNTSAVSGGFGGQMRRVSTRLQDSAEGTGDTGTRLSPGQGSGFIEVFHSTTGLCFYYLLIDF